MSMQTSFAAEVPEETRRLVEPLLPADSVYRLGGNEIEQIVSDEDFVDMYADDGRPAVNPVVLALVSVFQYCEKLPDRAAAHAAVMRLNWKYALRQELTWNGPAPLDMPHLAPLGTDAHQGALAGIDRTPGMGPEATPPACALFSIWLRWLIWPIRGLELLLSTRTLSG